MRSRRACGLSTIADPAVAPPRPRLDFGHDSPWASSPHGLTAPGLASLDGSPRAVASGSRLLPTRPAKDFHLQCGRSHTASRAKKKCTRFVCVAEFGRRLVINSHRPVVNPTARHLAHFGQHSLIGPGGDGDEMQQRLVFRRCGGWRGEGRHRFDALTLAGQQQPGAVVVARQVLRPTGQAGQMPGGGLAVRRQPPRQPARRAPALSARGLGERPRSEKASQGSRGRRLQDQTADRLGPPARRACRWHSTRHGAGRCWLRL